MPIPFPPKMRRGFKSSLVCLSLWMGGVAHGEGVLVYKEQSFHSDKTAHAFRYDRIEGEGFVTWVIVGKERKRFEKTQQHTWVELPTVPPGEVISTQEIAAITAQRDQIQQVSSRFPNAAPIAKKSLDLHNEWCKQLGEGMVRHRGEWMSREQYLDMQAKQAADEQAAKEYAERKRKELVEAEMQRTLAKEQEARAQEEAARTAIIDAKKAELRELQDEIGAIEEATKDTIQKLETLAEKSK